MPTDYLRFLIVVFLLILAGSGVTALRAQVSAEEFRLLTTSMAEDSSVLEKGPLALEPLSTGSTMSAAEAERYGEYINAYYDYRIRGLRHRSREFSWQQISSVIIFLMIIGLVLAGIYFSYLQFKKGMEATGEGETHLELSAGKVMIKSSVLGVIILVISLVFFYLYLAFIYPISEIH